MVASLFDEGYEKGWQILTHANGDAAVDQLIEAIRPAHTEYGPGDRRHVLIHGQYVRQDQLDALAELQVMPSLFAALVLIFTIIDRGKIRRGPS